MSLLRESLRPLFEETEILSDREARLRGQDLFGTHASAQAAGPPRVAPLLEPLANAIYAATFCRFALDAGGAGMRTDPTFIESLRNANTTRERWEDGWVIRQVMSSGYLEATRDVFFRTCAPGDFVSARTEMAWNPGAPIRVRFPKESLTLQDGMYFAFGEQASDQPEHRSLLRWYWSVRAEGAAKLVHHLSRMLNRYAIPFRAKCPAIPGAFERADSFVLFTSRRHARLAGEVALETASMLSSHLRSPSPIFTKPLAMGLAIADDPDDGQSFGISRARLVAHAILHAASQGRHDEPARWDALVRSFARAGLAIEKPHLNPGLIDPDVARAHQLEAA